MSDIEKNTVSAQKQLGNNSIFSFEKPEGKGKRIMFVGNSITRHGIKPEIGWHGDWGMAASSKEKDYVHLLIKKVLSEASDASFMICQAAEWERGFQEGESILSKFDTAKDFDADIVVIRLIENCPTGDKFDEELFLKEYKRFIKHIAPNARVIVTTGFWRHEKGDRKILEAAEDEGYIPVLLGDLGEKDENKALGLFEHEGVALHPGDKGMEQIADRIWEKLKKLI